MNDIISIVVPVYNMQDYLSECLDSLLCQTYKDIKIICIDDGSKDNSKEIINDYIKKDNRVSYHYQDNGGAASARNHGIDMFMEDDSSNYLVFVDSDDIVEKDYVETLYKALIENNADVSSCDKKKFNDNTPSDMKTFVLDKRETLKCYFKNVVFLESPVCKLFKKETFKDLRFPNGKHYEDTFLTYKIIEKCNRIAHINYYSYLIRVRDNSLTRSSYSNYEYDKVEAGLEIFNYYKGSEFERLAYNKYLGIIYYFIIKTNKNKDKVSKNKVAIEEVKKLVKKNGFRQADLRFIPFIIATKFNYIHLISIS